MIVVAGEALVDLLVGPDASVSAKPGGGPYNAARAIGRLGVPVSFLGRLSTDRFGQILLDRLTSDGVGAGLIVRTDEPSTLAVAELDAAGSATYRFYTLGTAAAGLTPDGLPSMPAEPAALHVGTLGLVLEPLADAVEALVGRLPPPTLVMMDLNARPAAMPDRAAWTARVERLLERVDVLSASLDDLAVLRPDQDPGAAAAGVLRAGPRVVLLTDGGRPARIVTVRGTTLLAPHPVEVVDTVGAGDTFGGGFLAAWGGAGRGRGTDLDDDAALHDATERALVGAALACTREGAEPPTAVELASALRDRARGPRSTPVP